MVKQDDITDLTRGVYRRRYAGYLRGRRINSVSLNAEAWFWRTDSAADDFGNLDGEPELFHAATAGRRAAEFTPEQVAKLLSELVDADLVRRYEVGGDKFLHVVGFLILQPAGKNGKRVRRFPPSPWDESELAGLIQVNPGLTSASDSDSDSDNHSKPAAQASAVPAKRTAAASDSTPVFLEFPTVAGKSDKSATWNLRESYVSELAETFAAVDVRFESRRALLWVKSKDSHRKTAGGMKDFLRRWMSREQDHGGHNGNHNEDPKIWAKEAARKYREKQA